MKDVISALTGGIAVLLVATAIGVAQNAMRDQPMKLIQRVPAKSRNATTLPGAATPGAAGGATDTNRTGSPSTTTATTVPGQHPDSLDAAAVKRMSDSGTVMILDARAPDAFAKGHIPGAINIPYDQLPNYLESLQSTVSLDDEVVAYCWGPDCDFSDQLATEMKLMGYTHVRVFHNGWEAWTRAGYPVKTGGGE